MADTETRRHRDAEMETNVSPSPCLPFSLSPLLPFLLCLSFAACNVPLYKVAPLPKSTALEGGQSVTTDGLEVTASAITEDDEAFARFDANLPLAGVLAVEVKLINRAALNSKGLSFSLQDATGQQFAPITPKKALEAVMDFEGVRLFAIEGKQQTRAQLEALALPKKVSLAAQEEKRGFLFFRVKRDVARFASLTLQIKGGNQPLPLPLLAPKR
jgi:hypothetical protein